MEIEQGSGRCEFVCDETETNFRFLFKYNLLVIINVVHKL